ncbi:MAG TPA: PilZ domain-containing protein [Pirellulaceae bacterium]|nr:PilZ domain-containing protein [Pirellulaceae bacterium]
MTTTATAPPEDKCKGKPVRHVPLPLIDHELLQRTAGGGAVWGDSRRFRRFVAAAEARLVAEGTYADAGHAPCSQTVLLRDLSRGGLRFLHGAELFPGERCGIKLPNGSAMRLEVMWCRRMGAGIYMSGCRFFSLAAPAKDDGRSGDDAEVDAAGD